MNFNFIEFVGPSKPSNRKLGIEPMPASYRKLFSGVHRNPLKPLRPGVGWQAEVRPLFLTPREAKPINVKDSVSHKLHEPGIEPSGKLFSS